MSKYSTDDVMAAVLTLKDAIEGHTRSNDRRLDTMQEQMNRRFDRVDERFDRMDVRFDRLEGRVAALEPHDQYPAS
jgi:flagellar capping protein FliD